MRLTQHQREAIRATVYSELGPEVSVRLFGSRLDDSAQGGDLDLLVELKEVAGNRAALASRLAALLQLALGDQRIDILVVDTDTVLQPVHKRALSRGVKL